MLSANLIVALLLPWLTGSLLIKWVADRFSPNLYGWEIYAGYGFLLGQVLVAVLLTVQNFLGFGIGFLTPLFALEAIGLVAGWKIYVARQNPQHAHSRDRVLNQLNLPKMSVTEGLLIFGLLVLIAAHVVPSVAEVIWRPLFPWDAWSSWGARAKTWFYLGELVPFVAPDQWMVQSKELVYSIAAYAYPTQVSLSQTWIALALGYWDGALINLPWLLCALSIGLILYGYARALGMSRPVSLLLCYLLLSIPIIQIHISLAGYADLWQAAYTSAAFSGLLVGWIKRDGFLITLGLAFALAGIWIKHEGMVWLILFGLVWGLLYVRRTGWMVLAGIFLVGLLQWSVNGSLAIEIPEVGTLGIIQNLLLIPGFASKEIIYHDVWWSLIANLFQFGSWNLFWYLFFITLASLLVPPQRKIVTVGALLMLIPMAAILFIFLFSDNSAWAKDFTAVNRLFIHFVPVWILVIGAVLSRFHLIESKE